MEINGSRAALITRTINRNFVPGPVGGKREGITGITPMEIEKFRLLVRQIETPAAKQGVSGEGAGNMTLKAKFDEYGLKAKFLYLANIIIFLFRKS